MYPLAATHFGCPRSLAKPPPIRWFESRARGGFGVMFDDLLAAGYTLVCLAAIKRFLG